MKKFLLLAAIAVSMSSQAQVTPKVQPETPVNGKSYILVNKAQTASQYMSRTSWDGALYFLGESDSNWEKYALTAFNNGDGTWSFGLPSTDEEGNTTYSYMAIPSGTANVNLNATEPAMWKLDAKDGGFYNLIVGEGNNPAALATANGEGSDTPTKDLRMHLNSGSQYFVATYFQGPWYPDCAGGITEIENEAQGSVTFAANDSTSFNWGFVSPEKMTEYYLDLQAVAAINSYYTDYCSIDDYEEGFLKSYQACADLYNSADYNEDDIETIKEILNAKVALYNEIEAAILLNETEDAALLAATENAKATFDKATSAAEIESATTALKNAEESYSLGTGDITSFGKNMSFEDLTAQDGNTTTGIGAVPTGWNVYIDGAQVSTAAEVKAAGINNWHGVNADCTGDIKDGQMGFGIWTSGIPTYEISQTIEGLDNGTYEVTAGLMAGANGSGSRLTTQRIFGNLNSTYYGSQDDYLISELDQSEVYTFANNEILTTDTEMRPVTVNAFVYDGTLTFGVRTDGNYRANNRTSANSAGGDGWFKTDNFRIISKGYIPEDAVAIYVNYLENLNEISGEKMAYTTQEKIDNAGSADITVDTPQEDIIKAILESRDLVAEANASVKAYAKFGESLEKHWEYVEYYEQKAGVGEYSDAVMEAQEVYDDASANTDEEIDAILAKLDEALQACIQSDDIEEGSDLTEYIQNPSFEDLSNQNNANSDGVQDAPKGWSLNVEGAAATRVTGAGWAAINSGDNIDVTNTQGEEVFHQYTDGEHLWGVWAGSIPEIEIYQTIKGLPAGTYTLSADIVVQNDWAGMNLGMQRLFANDYVTMFGAAEDYVQNSDEELYSTFPEDIRVAAEMDAQYPDAVIKHLTYAGNYSGESYGASSAPYTTSVKFGLAKSGEATIGFRTKRISAVTGELSSQASLGWFKLDNFRLTYDSTEVPDGADATPDATAIDAVKTSTTVEFYSLNGVRLAAPQKGINIVKMSNGTVSKVLVK